MSRVTAAELREQGAKAVDEAAAAHLRGKAEEVRTAKRWQLTANERSMLVRRLEATAEEIEQGLHRA